MCLKTYSEFPPVRTGFTVLLCFIDPRVGKIRNEASSCPGIFTRTLCCQLPRFPPSPVIIFRFTGGHRLWGLNIISWCKREFRVFSSLCPRHRLWLYYNPRNSYRPVLCLTLASFLHLHLKSVRSLSPQVGFTMDSWSHKCHWQCVSSKLHQADGSWCLFFISFPCAACVSICSSFLHGFLFVLLGWVCIYLFVVVEFLTLSSSCMYLFGLCIQSVFPNR